MNRLFSNRGVANYVMNPYQLAKRQKRTSERVAAILSRMLNGKPDDHQTVLEIERDDEDGNMNIPGAVMNAHIVAGVVPDGVYTLTHSGNSEQVTVRSNTIIWNPQER